MAAAAAGVLRLLAAGAELPFNVVLAHLAGVPRGLEALVERIGEVRARGQASKQAGVPSSCPWGWMSRARWPQVPIYCTVVATTGCVCSPCRPCGQ